MEPNIDTVIAKYAKRTPKKPSKGRAIFLSLLVILLAAGAAVGTLFLLNSSMKVTTTTMPQASLQTGNGPSAKEVVDKIASSETISTAQNYSTFRSNTTQGEATSDTATNIYPQNGFSYLTNVSAEDGLRFTLKNSSAPSNKEAMRTAIETSLKNTGFTKVSQDTSQLSSYLTTTYLNKGTVCQTVDYSGGSKQIFLEQGVLCSSHDYLQGAYKKVTTLLKLADPSVATSAKVVNQMVTIDTVNPNRKLLSLSVKTGTNDASTLYYFATLETAYQYIGKRPSPSIDDPTSYTLPAELQKNIADPQWGTFLQESIK